MIRNRCLTEVVDGRSHSRKVEEPDEPGDGESQRLPCELDAAARRRNRGSPDGDSDPVYLGRIPLRSGKATREVEVASSHRELP